MTSQSGIGSCGGSCIRHRVDVAVSVLYHHEMQGATFIFPKQSYLPPDYEPSTPGKNKNKNKIFYLLF